MKSGVARYALIGPSSNTQNVFITTLHSGTMTTHHGNVDRPAAIPTATPETTGDQTAASPHRGRWAHVLMCLPMLLVIAGLIMAGSISGASGVLWALGCMAMMATMMWFMKALDH